MRCSTRATPSGSCPSWTRGAEVQFEPEQFVEAGDLILVVLRQTARGRTSGAALEQSINHVWRIEGGTARELRVFSDRAEALEAVGLRT